MEADMINRAYDRVTVNNDLRETISNLNEQFPLRMYTNVFQNFIDFHISWHWHPDFEFTLVLEGRTEVCVDNESYILSQGEGMLINSCVMHMMRPVPERPDTTVASFVFPASFLESDTGSTLYEKYIAPFIQCKRLPALFFAPDLPWQAHVLNCLWQVHTLGSDPGFGREMRMRNLLCDAWLGIALNTRETIEKALSETNAPIPSPAATSAESRAKRMTAFIHDHYGENITVDDIAASANISRSECFRTFHARIHQKPIEYLIECRISNAQRLLRETSRTITDIASACGFNHSSYFCRLFKEKCGMSPKAYRAERHLNPSTLDLIGQPNRSG
ncbi:MAG: helix-turn-helix domain-containing protein [Clostridiales bacterium]|nr:helix-turn-helix domain-containing protein [Clostridiales bacterium]